MAKRNLAKFLGQKEMRDLQDYLTGATEDSTAGNIHHEGGDDGGGGGGGGGVGGSAAERAVERAAKRARPAADAGGVGGAGSAGKARKSGEGGSGGGGGLMAAGRGASGVGSGSKGGGAGSGAIEEAGRDRNGLLLTPGVDFSFALRIYAEAHKAKAGAVGDGPAGGLSSVGGARKKGKKEPIIIVPAATSSLITMLNIKRFLEEGVFEESSAVAARGEAKELKVMLTRRVVKAGGAAAKAQYEVVDNPGRLKPEDWARVVAVVALGKEWQFKEYKWPKPVEIFSRVAGIFVKWDSDVVPPAVAAWTVTTIDVARNRRHLDAASALKFWNTVDAHTRLHNPDFHRGD